MSGREGHCLKTQGEYPSQDRSASHPPPYCSIGPKARDGFSDVGAGLSVPRDPLKVLLSTYCTHVLCTWAADKYRWPQSSAHCTEQL